MLTEHTLEHLYPSDVDRLLKDLFRAVKPGAWLRVSVPDLQKYVDYYCGRPVHENFKRYYRDGNLAMRTVSQRHYHFSLWDAATMVAAHETGRVYSGFRDEFRRWGGRPASQGHRRTAMGVPLCRGPKAGTVM